MSSATHNVEQRSHLAREPDVRARLHFLFLTSAIYVVQAISGNAALGPLSHWLIPDGQTYYEVVESISLEGVDALGRILPEQFAGFPVNPLLFLVYFPFRILLGAIGYFVANQLIVQFIGHRRLFLALCLTPYFLLSFALPSKDLLVLAMFVPLLYLLTQRRYFLAAIVSVSIFLVRDGGGVIAFACVVAHRFAPRSGRRMLFLLGLGVTAVAVVNQLVYEFLGDAFIFARNLAIAQDEANFDLEGAGAANYLIRLFGNATNLAFRPIPLDVSGNVPVLSVAYWVSGVSQIVCLWFALATLWNKGSERRDQILSMLFLVSLMVISVNPLVQPRYQLFFVAILLTQVLRVRPATQIAAAYVSVALLSFAAATAYVVTGIGLPPQYDWPLFMKLY